MISTDNCAGLMHAGRAPEILSEFVPELRLGVWGLISWRIEEVREHRGRRLVFGRMSYRKKTGEVENAEVVVKVYKKDPGDRALRAIRRLWEAGFRAPGLYQVPRPYGYLPGRNVLIQARVRGVSWADLLLSEDDDASGRAADWLVRLQSEPPGTESGVRSGGSRSPGRLALELLSSFPTQAQRLEPVASLLVETLVSAGEPVLSHGDYHPENVYLTPDDATTAIDFDNFGRREAAYDVGYAIGQALIMSYLRLESFGPGARAGLAFWRRYELAGAAPWSRVAAQVARTFLQSLHYELCALRNGRLDLIEPWTDQMARWLRSKGPETLEDLIRRS